MSKLKVTLSLDETLLTAVDAAVKRDRTDSRSAVVEEAIRLWQLEQRRQWLDRETEAYYRSQTAAERREDHAWSRVAAKDAKRLWQE